MAERISNRVIMTKCGICGEWVSGYTLIRGNIHKPEDTDILKCHKCGKEFTRSEYKKFQKQENTRKDTR